MKQFNIGLVALILLTGMLAVVAQPVHGVGAMQRPERLDKKIAQFNGKVLEVKADAKPATALVAAYVRVASKDAPGKVPDEMAQQAARLTTLIRETEQRLQASRVATEQKRWRDHIAQLRANVDALLTWRQMEYTVTANDGVVLEGVKRDELATLEVGKRVSLYVRAERGADGRTPTKVVLTRDAVQLEATVPARILPYQQVDRNIAFYEIIGDVKTVAPFTVQVNDMTMQVETPQQYGVIRKLPLTIAELKAGQSIRLKLTRETERDTPKLQQVLVFLNVDAPFNLEERGGVKRTDDNGNRDLLAL